MTDKAQELLRRIVGAAQEMLDHKDAGGNRQHVYNLYTNDKDLDDVCDTLDDMLCDMDMDLAEDADSAANR